MINTRSAFGEERKSTPVQDVTTASAQINHTPADLHVGGNHISKGGLGGVYTHAHKHTHIQTKALVVPVQCIAHMSSAHTKLTRLPGRQVKNEPAATGFQGRGTGFTLSTPPSLSPRLAR